MDIANILLVQSLHVALANFSVICTTYLFLYNSVCIFLTFECDKTIAKNNKKLDLMFMKHYAPNRCLYIKVAKLRTGVGSAETSYLQNCSVKLCKEHLKVQICKGRLFENNIITFFLDFHQLIYSSSSISWPSLKLLAVIVFEIS